MTKIRSTDDSRINDVRGQGGGGGGSLFPGMGGGGGSGFPFPMKAGGGIVGILVLLASIFLPKLLGGHQSAAAVPASPAPATAGGSGSCTTDLEQIVCGATNEVQDYWNTALPKFYGTQYQYTKTTFFSDATSTGCGQASAQQGPFYCPNDNLVYLDLNFMQSLEKQLIGATSDLAEQYIVAHEYGHHIQNLLGVNAQVQQASQNDPSRANQFSVALELQADCYAGVWVGDENRRGNLDSANEIDEALAAAQGVGDDVIQQKMQGRVDPETFTHGTAEQRQTWFKKGFTTQDPRQCDTFNEVL